MDQYSNKEQVSVLISEFNCNKNPDVSKFLKKGSIRVQEADKGRTYLIIPEDDPFDKNRGCVNILGYFTLTQKHVRLPQDISKSKRKKYDGIDNEATAINCYLIGQLGKNDKYKDNIKGDEILGQAINIIQRCSEYVGGRTILVECQNKKPLKKFYNDNNFEYLSQDEETKLLQYILPLNKAKFVKSYERDFSSQAESLDGATKLNESNTNM